jgi:hypothetical protein
MALSPSAVQEYARWSREERLARLGRTTEDLARAIQGRGEAALARRPEPGSWAAVEVICHLRDNEEWYLMRLQQIMLMAEPRFVTTDPNRWAEERQYLRNDGAAALAAFAGRRAETLGFLRGLGAGDWQRAGIHADSRGRRTIDEFVSVMAWHDDNHLAQLRRALEGRA